MICFHVRMFFIKPYACTKHFAYIKTGQPIIDTELYETNPYIAENIALDVGIRDSMKLHIFNLVDHPIAVLLGFDTIFQQSIEEELDALLANPQLKGYYIRSPKDKSSGQAGVDTNFLAVKPSAEEFSKIVNSYINTPYYPETGWNGEGHNNFEGGMGINGFLSYYFSKHPEEYVELDRCIFANNLDNECIERVPDFSVVKSSKDYKRVCGGKFFEFPHSLFCTNWTMLTLIYQYLSPRSNEVPVRCTIMDGAKEEYLP